MFTKAEVRNSSGGLLTLQLGDTSSGLVVQEFTGLDPVKATLTSSVFANRAGSIFQSSHRENRNITLTLGLIPDPSVTTVRALRQQVYSYFMPESVVTLKFFVDDTDDSVEDGYQIVGTVETCESSMFVQEPVVHISIICFDPDFVDPIPVSITSMTTADTTNTYVPYDGTSKTGLDFTLNINRALSEFTIYYVDANNVTWSMDISASFIAGDVVTISTVEGNKHATLLRAGVSSSILYAVPPQAVWPKLAPGDNWLKVYATGAAIPVSVSYTKRYGGL